MTVDRYLSNEKKRFEGSPRNVLSYIRTLYKKMNGKSYIFIIKNVLFKIATAFTYLS